MSCLKIDRSQQPLLVVSVEGKQDWDDVQELCDLFAAEVAEHRHFYAILDFKEYEANVRHASRLGEWNRDNAEQLTTYCRGVALVAPDTIFEIALKAFLLITPFPYPHKVCKSLEDGRAWIRKCQATQREQITP